MMKKFLLVYMISISALVAHSKDGKDAKYPVSAIPEELKKDVSAVVREDETVFRINSRKSSGVHFHYVITIFNANAKEHARKSIFYDKKTKIKDLKASVYDANGETIRKLKTTEIIDRASYDGMSLFSDNRIKAFDLTQTSYPYTVEIEYDIDNDFLYQIDASYVGASEDISVQHFRYELIYPLALKPRYKAHNIDVKPTVSKPSSDTESVAWELSNIAPLKFEPMSLVEKQIKWITAAPTAFEYDGYAGDMTDWNGIGKWQQSLNQNRDVLPEATKKKVHELTAGLKTNEEKAKVLYEYMQSRTRYVGIQLGIGGWQPFDATTVDQTGYGDCKALSNYMVSLLKEAGVKGYYTKIRAGDYEEIDTSFPSSQTNHVIVAVPNQKDTLWLECTSQTNPFGYMGGFTGNRHALMVTEDGGHLVKTIYYPADKNVQTTIADVTLDATGNAKAKIATSYSGLQYENNSLSFFLNQSTDDQKKWIQRTTSIPSFDVGQFTLTNKKDKNPTAIVKMDLTLNKYASVSNKRVFLMPNLMNRSKFIPEKVENRKTPFVLQMAYTDIDTIRYHIPEDIYPEFLPPNSKFTSRFGSYESGFKLDQGSLIYFRKMIRKDGEYPADAYQELIDFYKNINKADNAKLVFLSKT